MSVDSKLRVVHVFPSESSYNINKGSVGAEDLALVPMSGMPIGHIYFSVSKTIPAGSLPLLGTEVSRDTYADLWAEVQKNGDVITEAEWQAQASANGGNTAKYSDGNGTTTFRLPSLKCWVRGASNLSDIGKYLEAGLPNITGKEASSRGSEMVVAGAFYNDTNDGTLSMQYASTSSSTAVLRQYFDASRSNPIYGKSNTVQPESIIGLWLVKAFGTVTNVGSTDVSKIAQDQARIEAKIDGKVDKQGSAYVVESYRNGTEWYRVWSDGWLEQGGKSNGATTITLKKPYVNSEYTVILSKSDGKYGGNGQSWTSLESQTTTSFVTHNNLTHIFDWRTEGQGA